MSDNNVNRRTVLGAVGTTIVGGMIATGSAAAEGHAETFSAELTGEAEVPPVETNASGRTTFEVAEDGSAVHFEVFIDCIQNVNQGHIHLGAEGENGPVVVWLYPQETREPELIEGVQRDFVLAEGTLTDEDLVGDFEGESLDALIEVMREEGAYVNIHSEQNPAGEIRGQIVPDEESEVPDTEEPPEDDDDEEEEDVDDDEEDVDDEDEDEPDDEDPDEDDDDDPDDEEEDEDDDDDEEPAVDPSDALEIAEVNVLGSDPDEENIVIRNSSDQAIDLSGFEVFDAEGGAVEDRNTPEGPYVFSDFTLGAGDTVTLWSGSGSDDAQNVYWDQPLQVWNQEGDTIRIFDADGNLVLQHSYESQTSIQFVFSVIRSLFA